MKLTLFTVAGLVASAAALPENWGKHEPKPEVHHPEKPYDCQAHTHGLTAFPFDFTSTLYGKALPRNIIIANGSRVPGQEGARGYFNVAINSAEEVICWNITLTGVTGDYQSPADTATHIHESAEGLFGPPRIAFPNPTPTGDGDKRTSVGCMKGPFKTGITNAATGLDTATGFKLSQIEAAPENFAVDSHTVMFPAGAVRGQLGFKTGA